MNSRLRSIWLSDIHLGTRECRASVVVYRFRPYPPKELSRALHGAGLEVLRLEGLSARDFPANLTRLSVLARKP